MASRRVLPHTVHLFNYIGEVNDEAQFQESVIRFCYCSWNEGSGSSKAPSDSAKLYVFDANSIIEDAAGNRRTYISPEAWRMCADKSNHFTFSDNGNDYFQIDDGEKFSIRKCSHKVAGSRRMWHHEVEGK